jgi:hypothetical protein
MGVFQNNLLAGAAAAASAGGGGFYSHQIEQSVRFDDGSSSYLSRTHSGTATNEDVGLISFWFKRGNNVGSTTNEAIAGGDGSSGLRIEFNTNNPTGFSDAVTITTNGGGAAHTTTARFRDHSGWTNFIIEFNSDDSTTADRFKWYINGLIYPPFTSGSGTGTGATDFWRQNGTTHITSGLDFAFTKNGGTTNFGRSPANSSSYYDGYIAEVIVVDGSAAYTDVGEFKNGVWIPKQYTGSFGNNGYHLKFENASDLGNDSSGNNNDFTANNMGADHQVLDTPTTGAGG